MAAGATRRRAIGAQVFHPMREWIDHLSFRARAFIIVVVFMVTVLAMMDSSAQLLADLGKVVFESAVSASWR